MEKNNKRVKLACYMVNVSMSIVSNLPPILFLPFRTMYNVSFSFLGLLVLVNFVAQLLIDLIFSFFSHKFNVSKSVKMTPLLEGAGLLVYALWPLLFPGAVHIGLLIGTIIFSASGGFVEVLITPVVAAIPSDNPDRETSALHSAYAWGTTIIIPFCTLFLFLFGIKSWQILTLILTLVPLFAFLLFWGTKIPRIETPKKVSGAISQLKNRTLLLSVAAIFLGGATECTMAQWASGYLEGALSIPKVWGDIFGVAVFALMLGIGRTLYAKIGKNIGRTLFLSAVGAFLCYLTAAVTLSPILGLFACAFTGFCSSMLWPGNLIAVSKKIPDGGVFIYAMMAAGGDLGASVGPQLIGIITDISLKSETVLSAAQKIGITVEQLGMKLGMLSGMMFPLIAIPLYFYMWKKYDVIS